MNKKSKLYLVLLSLIFFIISLTQSAITIFHIKKTEISSLNYFLIGGFGFLGGGFLEWLIWSANPLYCLSIILFLKNYRISFWVNSLAIILALSFRTWHEILASESGAMATIISFNSGYYLWIISIVTLWIGTLNFIIKKNETPTLL